MTLHSATSYYRKVFSDTRYLITNKRVVLREVTRKLKPGIRDVSLNDIVSTRLVVGRRGIRRLYSSVLIVDRHLNKRVEDMANEKLRTDSGSERVVWDQTRDLHSFGSGKVAKTYRSRFKVRRPALLSYLSVQDARRAREIIVSLTNK